jgi:hypothetical protein
MKVIWLIETCYNKTVLISNYINILKFAPCIIRRSRNDQQYAQICTTALLYIYIYISAPTCFGSSLPSSGSFWIRLSYMKIQIGLVLYHIMLVKWHMPSAGKHNRRNHNTLAHRPLNQHYTSCQTHSP